MNENVFELVGIQKINFKNDQGQTVSGTKIHYVMSPTANQVNNGFLGNVAGTKFFPADTKLPSPLECRKYYEFCLGISGGKPIITGIRPVVSK